MYWVTMKIWLSERGTKLKIKLKTVSKNIVLFSIATSIALTGGAGSVLAKEAPVQSNSKSHEAQYVKQETKYSKKVMRAVRESLGIDAKSTKLDSKIELMPKVKVMDHYLTSFGKKVKGNEVRRAVEEIFGADLDIISKNNYGSAGDLS